MRTSSVVSGSELSDAEAIKDSSTHIRNDLTFHETSQRCTHPIEITFEVQFEVILSSLPLWLIN